MKKLLLTLVLLLMYSCGTTSIYQCKDKIGIEKDLCEKDVKCIQHQTWMFETSNGYREA